MRPPLKLNKTTYIHAVNNLVIKIKRGTPLSVDRENKVIRFPNGVQITKLQGEYFVSFHGSVNKVIFPNGGRTPFPFSLL